MQREIKIAYTSECVSVSTVAPISALHCCPLVCPRRVFPPSLHIASPAEHIGSICHLFAFGPCCCCACHEVWRLDWPSSLVCREDQTHSKKALFSRSMSHRWIGRLFFSLPLSGLNVYKYCFNNGKKLDRNVGWWCRPFTRQQMISNSPLTALFLREGWL